MTMMISLSLGLSAIPARLESVPVVDGSADVSVVPFTRNHTIFDSNAANGGNAADIPLSGTTDAADGAQIMCEIVRAESGTVKHGAVAIATASGGTWSGSYPAVPRNEGTGPDAEWLVPRVWVQGNPAAKTASTTSFGVGVHTLALQASNIKRGVIGGNEAALVKDTVPTANQYDFQYVYAGVDGVADDVSAVGSINNLIDANTASIPAMAAMYHNAAPGLKVMAGFCAHSGSNPHELIDADSAGGPSFDALLNLVDVMQADGSEIGSVYGTYFNGALRTSREDRANMYAAMWYGEDLAGNVLPGVDQTAQFTATVPELANREVNHVWAQAVPTMLTGRTKMLLSYIHQPSRNDVPSDILDTPMAGAVELRTASWASSRLVDSLLTRTARRSNDGTHYEGNSHFGMPETFRQLAMAHLKAGPLDYPLARFDEIEWTANYVDLGSSAGDITTLERIENGGSATNMVEDPINNPGVAGNIEAVGLWWDVTTPVSHVEIVDKTTGNPSTQGKLRVYPSTPGSIDGNTRLYWYLSGHLYPWINGNTGNDHYDAGILRHFPVVLQPEWSASAVGGQPINMFEDVDTINNENTLAAGGFLALGPGPYYTAVDGTSRFTASTGITSFYDIEMNLSAGNQTLQEHDTIKMNQLIIMSDGVLRVYLNEFRSTTNDIIKATPPGTIQDGVRQQIHVALNKATQAFRVWVDGTLYDDGTNGIAMTDVVPPTGDPFDVSSSRDFKIFEDNDMSATVYDVAIWNGDFDPTERAIGVEESSDLFLRIEGSGAVTEYDPRDGSVVATVP